MVFVLVSTVFCGDTLGREMPGGNSDIMVRPGLQADRDARSVTLLAKSTGLIPSGNPPEFILVAPNSGHDYESIAVSQARAGDLHDALVFIGMPEGRACDPAALRFWPKGERVVVTFRWTAADGSTTREAKAEQLLRDNRLSGPSPNSDWVFVSERRAGEAGHTNRMACAADALEPNSIISTYNEPATVLDVPRKAQQGTEYGHILLNPENLIPANAAIEVRIRPEDTNGVRRVVDMDLNIRPGTGKDSAPVFDLRDGKALNLKGATINEALRVFSDLNDAGKDPFVAISFDAALTAEQVRSVSGVISAIETEKGIRAEPPPADQLFYRAFLPEEKNRDRQQRLAQPWEVRFEHDGNGVKTTLIQIKESWPEQGIKPDLTVETVPTPKPEDLKRALAERGPGMPVILAFVPGDLRYGEIMRFLGPLLPEYGTVFVFVEK